MIFTIILKLGALFSILNMIDCWKHKNKEAYIGWFAASCFALSAICGIYGV